MPASLVVACKFGYIFFFFFCSDAERLHLVMLPITQKLNLGPFLQGNFLQHSIQRSYNEFECHKLSRLRHGIPPRFSLTFSQVGLLIFSLTKVDNKKQPTFANFSDVPQTGVGFSYGPIYNNNTLSLGIAASWNKTWSTIPISL